ncbi:hypothetical protein [Phenylobacterium sp.]|jgi:hypothetical protein|uniref:hypothetical protein n=1 Tax=Phenylobacterium sp. TaxID=1871053 RepID=UPI002F3E7C89
MLSVIVEATDAGDRLPALLAALTSAAVDGLVREVLIVGGGPAELLEVLREETGAELAQDLAEAIRLARSERLLVMPATIRLRGGWLEKLGGHVRSSADDALIVGEGSAFMGRSYGLLMARTAASGLVRSDLKHLRGKLGRGAARLA